ncbi:MAG: NAD(P)H-binding protein [Deltaproteobacteria bacterium]|nr:NAD(P)H-binding protein [Deltaproteobacteria bacterium]
MPPQLDPIVVTGANGQLGRALLRDLAAAGHTGVRALVRSTRAADSITALALAPAPTIRVVDYTSPHDMEAAIADARFAVHLVGIIKETRDTRYVDAHEKTCHALALAASRTRLERIVHLSILGSLPDSSNPCLASKGRAERMLLEDRVSTTVLRVPMVIGGDDMASASLRRQARARSLRLVGGGRTLQQPIDARDVRDAVRAALAMSGSRNLVLDAGGPECLSHRNLVLRAARHWQNEPRIHSLPHAIARAGVGVLERLLPNPPITRAMFDILQHDDRVDPRPFCEKLGLTLRPLDTTLADFVGPASVDHGRRP